MNWIIAHWTDIITALGGIIILARVIVKLTPTPKDDTWLEKIVTALKHIGLNVKLLILAPACLFLLASCTTDPLTGEKAFFGVTSKSFQAELKDIGLQLANATTQAAAQAVLNVAEVKLNEATAKLAANTDANPLVILALTKGVDQAQSLVMQARLKVAAFRFGGKEPVLVLPNTTN